MKQVFYTHFLMLERRLKEREDSREADVYTEVVYHFLSGRVHLNHSMGSQLFDTAVLPFPDIL